MLRRRRWLIAGVLIAATAVAGYLLTGSSPPRQIRLATGQPGGMYDRFGAQYVARLGHIGLRTVAVPSGGSLDNLRSLLRGEVDVAFVQGGTYPLVADPETKLRGIAAIYLEPLWVFHRGGPTLRSISEFAGRRVSIGLPGSGTSAVAAALLKEHGIDPTGPDVERLANPMARQRLEQGTLHAAFFVTGPGDPVVLGLLGRPGVRLLSFDRNTAYARKFPGLVSVRLPEGLLDLRHNLPAADMTLLAPAALLACRAELHPRVIEQILKVAQRIHASGSLIDPPLHFPTREGVDLRLHEAAEIYLSQGESFLSRMLPYPLLRWTLILRVLVVSLIIWIPMMNFLPEVAGWRIDRRFARLYAVLRSAERRLDEARDPGELQAGLDALDRLVREAQPLCDRVPAGRQHDVYNWRVHVAFVRAQAQARLAAIQSVAEQQPQLGRLPG
jgi:TRAP transporter TAXI family solute receptor